MSADVRTTILILVMGAGGFAAGWMAGWVRGYEEATAIQEKGWNQIARGLDMRQRDAKLDALLRQPTATDCYETLYDAERPVPLLLALERARQETTCLTESYKAQLRRPAPAKLPAGASPSPAHRVDRLAPVLARRASPDPERAPAGPQGELPPARPRRRVPLRGGGGMGDARRVPRRRG